MNQVPRCSCIYTVYFRICIHIAILVQPIGTVNYYYQIVVSNVECIRMYHLCHLMSKPCRTVAMDVKLIL